MKIIDKQKSAQSFVVALVAEPKQCLNMFSSIFHQSIFDRILFMFERIETNNSYEKKNMLSSFIFKFDQLKYINRLSPKIEKINLVFVYL